MATAAISAPSTVSKYPAIRPLGRPASPSSEEEQIDGKVSKARRTTHACNHCRSKRAKCDGGLPTCSTCARRGKSCEYTNVDGRRRKGLTKTIEALEDKLSGLENLVTCLQDGSSEDAAELLTALREGRLDPDICASLSSPQKTSSESPSSPLPDSVNRITIYNLQNLPPKEAVSLSFEAFCRCSGTLFSTFDTEEADAIFNRVYKSNDSKRSENAILCEVCAVGAIGSQYTGDKVTTRISESMYSTAVLSLADCVEEDPLRSMRILVCLSMYCFMSKRNSARVTIHDGLQIARWLRPQMSPAASAWNSWRKTYRSLVFLECWLSATLGYQSDLTDEEIDFTRMTIHEPQPVIENDIQAQLSNVGFSLASIVPQIYLSRSSLHLPTIQQYSIALDRWRESLPEYMRLSSLDSSDIGEAHRHSLLLVHLMYLGTKILLTRRLYLGFAEGGVSYDYDLDPRSQQVQHLQGECLLSAQMCARLLDILTTNRVEYRRCWLCIGHGFASATVLLFAASQGLVSGNTDGAKENLALAEICISMLAKCGVADHVALNFHRILKPLYQDLLLVLHRQMNLPFPKVESSVSSGDEETPMSTDKEVDMQHITVELAQLLQNPFGRSRHPRLNSNPTLNWPPHVGAGCGWWDESDPYQGQAHLNLFTACQLTTSPESSLQQT